MTNKVLLIGLDGFRPDMMTADLTPNLFALAAGGVLFTNHRSVFPSETYVNTVSTLTGQPPGRHGIVANSFFDRAISRTEPWIGNRVDMIEAGMAGYGGKLIASPTLGDRLAAVGERLWVLSGNSPGSARLKHPRVADCPGHVLIAGQDIDASRPADRIADLAVQLGRPERLHPEKDSIAVQRYLTDAFLQLARSEPLPDVAIVWYGEPDHSLHTFGLGAAPTKTALRAIDAELGRLVDWWKARPDQDRIQLIVASDHGHITQTKRIDTQAIFRDAGFSVSNRLDDGADLALVPGYVGNLRVRDSDPGLIAAAAQAFMDHPDAGLIFTSGGDGAEGRVPGTFSTWLAGIDHPRCPDIVFTLRADDSLDSYGFVGTCCFDNPLSAGVGYHGGLHQAEMSPLLVMAGSAFAEEREFNEPTSVTDLLPILSRLLEPAPSKRHVRTLGEIVYGTREQSEVRKGVLDVGVGAYVQRLHLSRYRDRMRIDKGLRM